MLRSAGIVKAGETALLHHMALVTQFIVGLEATNRQMAAMNFGAAFCNQKRYY